MTESEVISRVRAKVSEAGSMRELARRWGVSISYLSDILNGRRAPGVTILGHLGLERVKTISYRELASSSLAHREGPIKP
jgi:transcriptional regulator with XRE-family HTH domain